MRSTWTNNQHRPILIESVDMHLQAYLNEFTFRFNRRAVPMAAFQTALGIGSQVEGPTYEGIYKGEWKHPNPVRAGRRG